MEETVKQEEQPSKKSQTWQKKVGVLGLSLVLLMGGLLLWKESAESSARWYPEYEKVELAVVESVEDLSSEELEILLAQTGLSEIGLKRLEEAGRLEELEYFQRGFFLDTEEMNPQDAIGLEIPFTTLPMACIQNSPISWEEYILDQEGNRGVYLPMVPLEEGDILLTPNSHSFGYRQGHAALVVDAEEQFTLESVVLGSNSVLQPVSKWNGFPAVLVLRSKDDSLGDIATDYAMEFLLDVPYDLSVGVFSKKDLTLGEKARGTQCSHLVWQAYAWAGVDLDANGWGLVTPYNLSQSENLELVQIWGMDPEKMWC